MATADQLKALIKSHAEGDDSRFYSVAMQVAAHAARGGHGRLAEELREVIDKAKAGAPQAKRPVALVQPRGELAGLLTALYPKTRLSDMVLDGGLRARLDRVALEQRQHRRLAEHGFDPARKLLLVGPPGTGKTMTAAALAGELGLPLFSIQLHALITKFMGETASKLRLIFDALQQTRAVYLFDEFDALGGARGVGNDVGEARRILNSFLQFLDLDDSQSVIVAATNHPVLLDEALFRRFDMRIDYSLPTPPLAEAMMRTRLARLDTDRVNWRAVVRASTGLSNAELVRACEYAAKNAILAERADVDTKSLVEALEDRRRTRGS